MAQKKPFALIVMDGWGVAPACDSNGVTLAKTPNFNNYISNFPTYTLLASGEAVGLSWGEIGNSEVGHLNLGVGKIMFQNLPRIDREINDGSFFSNESFLKALEHVKKNRSRLHLIGLMSDGKVHSTITHFYAFLDLAKKNKVKDVYIHGFLDGRDTLYNGGKGYVQEMLNKMKEIGVGELATLSGRYYAMDRDNHWERVEKTYKAMTEGVSDEYFDDPGEAVEASYAKKVYDEEFIPVVIGKQGKPTAVVEAGDACIFINYRSDRARQLTKAFVADDFNKFNRTKIDNLVFVTMTEYEKGLPVDVAMSRDDAETCLARVASESGVSQYHIAETEKYAHVTFFFNGGKEDVFKNEDRDVIPSPRVASFADKPEMSALDVTQKLSKVMLQEKHDFYVVNYANPDMVGHTGDINAVIKAVQTTDYCVGQIVDLILSKGGSCILTADHGNCEELRNLQTGEISKDHSTNPVPCVVIGEKYRGKTNPDSQVIGGDLSLLRPVGLLSDVSATALKMMDLEIPKYLSGRPLI
ncbi:TPA: 2,3-bisphosphoglycerate-independent phosphoglycerate mutase [Candidatus Falkowbacteria bacterium]|nr:2,3-bisphosphoglycerate-independent phosphoglycerate mutase [Candidatus Falkowbacteria bacterium]